MGDGAFDSVQEIRFVRSSDGVGIAYAVHGSGPPLLIDACWLSHLQLDWQSPVWRHFLVHGDGSPGPPDIGPRPGNRPRGWGPNQENRPRGPGLDQREPSPRSGPSSG